MGKKRPQLETKILQVTRFTGKGKQTIKVGNHSYTHTLQKKKKKKKRRSNKNRRIEMQATGDAFAIKRPKT